MSERGCGSGVNFRISGNIKQKRTRMAHAGFKVIDSDMHVIEPIDLWQRYIDPAFKAIAPVGVDLEGHHRLFGLSIPGKQMGQAADWSRQLIEHMSEVESNGRVLVKAVRGGPHDLAD